MANGAAITEWRAALPRGLSRNPGGHLRLVAREDARVVLGIMRRPMTGFFRDDVGDWTARLSCGHAQHVRHDPPLVERPWVTSEEGRNSRLGQSLDCLRCDAFEMPSDVVAYKQTAIFTADSVPPALRKDHATAVGVWGRVVVLEGRLRYRVDALATDVELSPERPGIVVPEVRHHVEPLGPARFFVEFYRAPS